MFGLGSVFVEVFEDTAFRLVPVGEPEARGTLKETGAAPFETTVETVGEMRLQIAIGSGLLFLALVMFLVVMLGTWLAGRGVAPLSVNGHIPDPLSGPEGSPRVLDNLKVWTAVAVVPVAMAYGLPIWSIVSDGLLTPGSPPIPV
jgi:cytochrome c oxidase subunit 1